MIRKLTISSLLYILFTSCYYDGEIPSDQNVWPVARPSELSMDERKLLQMDSAILANPNQSITSVVVIKDGHLVFENYYHGNDRNSLFELGGVSSSLSNLALGRALDMGLIAAVDDSLYKYLPDYAQIFDDSPLKKSITFDFLMTMKSGLSWNEFPSIFDGQLNDIDYLIQSDDWVEYILNRPIDVLPGNRFTHNSATPILIAAAIENEYGDNIKNFLSNEVFEPMGVENFNIAEFGNNLNSAWGISMTTLDLAKIGYLYKQKGDWFGKQILDESYASASVDIQTNVDYSNDFGWLWWKYSENSTFLSLEQNDAYFSAGIGDQRLYVIPHLDLVVAITGKNERTDFSLPAPLVLKEYIISSIQ